MQKYPSLLETFQYINTLFIVVWNKWINIAAINCAQQDCKNFSINGTPTVRVFGPRYPGINENNETENIGRDVVARHEVQYWYETILSEVETIQQEELVREQETGSLDGGLLEQGLPNMIPYRYVMYCFNNKGCLKLISISVRI